MTSPSGQRHRNCPYVRRRPQLLLCPIKKIRLLSSSFILLIIVFAAILRLSSATNRGIKEVTASSFRAGVLDREMQAVPVSSSELHNVFVYGSLLADEVVTVLLKRVPRSCPAILRDFHRFSIKGRVYPAILPVDKKSITGKVIMDVTTPELDILDTFEDVEYERRSVLVNMLDNSDRMEAHTYVWGDANDPDLYGEWDFEEWKQKHMDDFVKMTIGFVEELEQPESKPRVATYESFFSQDRGDSTVS